MKWTGIRPLVMHNGLLADPTNPYTVAIKKIVSKGTRKLTITDYEQRDALEWEGGLYWDDDLGLVIPADNIERCIQLGAQKSRLGKDVQAAVFCTEVLLPIVYDGPKKKAALMADPRFTLRKCVVIQKSRLVRVRPMIPNPWSIDVEIEFDDSVIDAKRIFQAAVDAGALVGLGDWRPKFGRFSVEQI